MSQWECGKITRYWNSLDVVNDDHEVTSFFWGRNRKDGDHGGKKMMFALTRPRRTPKSDGFAW